MLIENFDLSKNVLIIAEIGNNHEGIYTLAEELIGLAVESGVDAVKFQTFKTQYFVSNKDIDRYNRLKSFELSEQEFIRLSEHAKKAGVLFISTPLDLESAKFLDTIVHAFKIASSDNNFYPLLEYIANTAKPVIMSTGLADISLINQSKDFIYNIWRENNINTGLAILHCVTSYPVPIEQANLMAIQHLIREYNCTIGYSDHTNGIFACQLAVALGSRIIEKHFTINKNYSSFRDHQLSADPTEMSYLVKSIREAEILLGNGIKSPQPTEIAIEKAVRRSIAAKRDLEIGHSLSYDDLIWIRPGNGLAVGKEKLLIGKKLLIQIKIGDFLSEEMVQ